MAQPGIGSRARPQSTGTAMIAPAATPPANPAADADLAACSLSAAPGQSAAPGLLTFCRSQRRCSSGRDDDACVTAGQTAIVLWILPLRMPLTRRTLTGFGFELCI
jgi:hypothetical protein